MTQVRRPFRVLEFREAAPGDLPSIVAMTAATRERLASWAPGWWAKSQGADEVHPMWLEHLVTNEPGTMHVATAADRVVGCLGITQQSEQWFLDDVSVREDDRWPDFVVGLVRYIKPRPALTCVSPQDRARAEAMTRADCSAMSSYWIRKTTKGSPTVGPLDPSAASAPRPPHTFGGGPLSHDAAEALAFTTDDGTVIGSSPVTAPPVYDPGGTVTVVDLVTGSNRRGLLDTALDVAGARGDVLVCVVCGHDDAVLATALSDADFVRTVDVYSLPTV